MEANRPSDVDLLRDLDGIVDFDTKVAHGALAYPTQPGHGLILAARDRSTQHALAVAISKAYFLEAKNTFIPDVLADIAVNYGFGRAEALAIAGDPAQHRRVEEEAAHAAAKGIRSVPHFVFADHIAINGGRSEDEIASAIKQAIQANKAA